jgi:hypothetical protein
MQIAISPDSLAVPVVQQSEFGDKQVDNVRLKTFYYDLWTCVYHLLV